MKVIFVFAGILKYKGRLLKQISTLEKAGNQCVLIHGKVEAEELDYSEYSFDVISIRLRRSSSRAIHFVNNLVFNVQAAERINDIRPDAVICEELYGALSGAIAKKRNRDLFFVFDSNELFMHMGMSKLKEMFWKPIHAIVYKQADVIMHAEINRLKFFESNYSTEARHFLLENLPDTTNMHSLRSNSISYPVRTVYMGALLPDRGYEDLIKSFADIDPGTAVCDLIGFGAKEYEDYLRELISSVNMNHVRILPPVSHENLLNTLREYDVGFAFYENRNLNQYYCAPNKIYDYITCGLPVITNNYPGLITIVEDNELGTCISKITSKHIEDSVRKIVREEFWANITPHVRNRYSWDNQVESFLLMLHEELSRISKFTANSKGSN